MPLFDADKRALEASDDFKAASAVDVGMLTDEGRFRALTDKFLSINKAFRLRTNDVREHLFPGTGRAESAASVQVWLTDIGRTFGGLGGHLSAPPERYAGCVGELVSCVPEAHRGVALARLTFACWMFDRPPEALLKSRCAEELIRPWMAGIGRVTIGRGASLPFATPDEVRNAPLSARLLVNPSPAYADLTFTLLGHAVHTLALPANGCLHALFAGDEVCCVKGAIVCGDAGVALARGSCGDAPLQRADGAAGRTAAYPIQSGGALTDYASDGKSGVHLLIGDVLALSDDVDEDASIRTLCRGKAVIGVYSRGSAVAALTRDGTLISNIRRLNGLDARAVAEDTNNLHVLTREGEVVSALPMREAMTPDGLRELMLRRFPEPARYDPLHAPVERVLCGGVEFALSADGKLSAREA